MNCIICNKEFNPKNSLHKYCSSECKAKKNVLRNSSRRTQKRKEIFESLNKNRSCLVCGKDFIIKQQHRHQIYCSEDCSNKAERIFGNKREADLDYKDRIRFGGNKYKVLERDNYECQLCGNKLKLVVHHLDHSGQTDNSNNDMSNLITLCRRCHINIHKIGGQI